MGGASQDIPIWPTYSYYCISISLADAAMICMVCTLRLNRYSSLNKGNWILPHLLRSTTWPCCYYEYFVVTITCGKLQLGRHCLFLHIRSGYAGPQLCLPSGQGPGLQPTIVESQQSKHPKGSSRHAVCRALITVFLIGAR